MGRPAVAVEQDLQYRQIFEATSDGLVVNDPETGVVVEVNPAFCRMHGYAYEELVGVHPTVFIHPDDHHLFGAFLEAFQTGATFKADARDVRKDGSVFDVEVHAEAFVFRGKPHLLGVVRDMSEAADAQRRLRQQIEERTRELAALVQMADQITATQDLAGLMRATTTQVRAVIDTDGAYVYLLRDGMYTLEHGDGPPSPVSLAASALDAIASELEARRGVLVWATDRDRRAEQTQACGLRPAGSALIVVPMIAAGALIGFVALHRVCDDTDHAPHVIDLAQAIAGQVAIAITNIRLADAARVAAAVDERNRIARDLHDAISQTLFSTTMHARAAEMAVAKLGLDEDHPARRHTADVANLTLGALAEMRALIFELRPGALAEAGLAVALRKHAAVLTARHELPIEVRVPDDRVPLDPAVEEELYRIAQEALSNVVRHAHATRGVVDLWQSEESVRLRVSDDGSGFDPARERPGHYGLRTMAERAERAGGRLEFDSSASGSSVVVRVPAGARR